MARKISYAGQDALAGDLDQREMSACGATAVLRRARNRGRHARKPLNRKRFPIACCESALPMAAGRIA